MDQKIIDLFDEFIHGGMDRRDFLERPDQAGRLDRRRDGRAAAAAERLGAGARWSPANDARLATERVTFESPKGKISGYLARPKSKGKRPAMLVIHENRGLNPHIQDVARRLAVEGFLAYAPDLLSLVGGTPADEDEALKLHPKIEPGRRRRDAGRRGVVPQEASGIDRQGRRGRLLLRRLMVNRLAAASHELDAGVAYYGRQVPATQTCRTSPRRCCCNTRRTTTA